MGFTRLSNSINSINFFTRSNSLVLIINSLFISSMDALWPKTAVVPFILVGDSSSLLNFLLCKVRKLGVSGVVGERFRLADSVIICHGSVYLLANAAVGSTRKVLCVDN